MSEDSQAFERGGARLRYSAPSSVVPARRPDEVRDDPLPSVMEVEKAVLGAMMIDASCIPKIRQILEAEDRFYRTAHRKVYGAMLNLADAGVAVDQVTVTQRLSDTGDLEKIDGPATVAQLAGEMATASNSEFHARIVLDCWRKRQAIRVLQSRTQELFTEAVDVTVTVDRALGDLQEVQRHGQYGLTGERAYYRGQAIYDRRRSGMLRRIKASPIITGYSALDRRMPQALFPGGVTAIASRPSVGKSTLKANLTIPLCEFGFGVISVTPEQGFDREMDRLDSIYTAIPLREIKGVRDWLPGDPRVKKILKANGEIYSKSWNFTVMPRRDISWSDVESMVLLNQADGIPTHVIFVDLMDRLKEIRAAGQGDRANAIKELLQRSAEFAQRVNCHVVMLAQINRGNKMNDDGRPSLNTIKDSGGWEEVCDNVLLLHPSAKDQLDIIVGKQRDGEAGNDVVIRLPFDKETLTLGNRDYRNVKDPKGLSHLNLRKPVEQ